jgi:hypothetical protein
MVTRLADGAGSDSQVVPGPILPVDEEMRPNTDTSESSIQTSVSSRRAAKDNSADDETLTVNLQSKGLANAIQPELTVCGTNQQKVILLVKSSDIKCVDKNF